MAKSIGEVGWGDSLTVSADGVVISGNQRQETAVELDMTDVIVVHSDGTRPVVHIRDDVQAGTEKARKLGLYLNRVGQVNLEWDPAVLQEMEGDGLNLGELWNEAELTQLFAGLEQPAPAPPGENGFKYTEQYAVTVVCNSEAEQEAVYNKLTKDGYNCKVVVV